MIKKSLVALAAMTVAGLASAQSSVTLFGILDAGVSYYDASAQNPITGVTTKRSQWAQTNSGLNSSRLGFRGTEDLGGGLAASFWVEAGIANDTGAAGGGSGLGGSTNGAPNSGTAFFNRRSTVSLSGPFGEVRIGRDYTPTFTNDSAFDPFGTNGVGNNLIFTVNNGGNVNYIRASNSLAYFLPSNIGGFYGSVQYALHENVKSTGVDVSKAGGYAGGRFGYANGPVDVAVAVGQSILNDLRTPIAASLPGMTPAVTAVPASQTKANIASLGASYDFGVVKLFGEYSNVKYKQNFDLASLSSTTLTRQGGMIGLTAPVGAGLIRASFAAVKDSDNVANVLNATDPKARQFALGYVHNLSKRTALYATASRVTNSNNVISSTPGSVAGSGANLITTGTTFPAGVPKSANGYDFGVRHSF